MQDARFNVKIVLFSLFTRFAYLINIHRNKFLIVQAEWLRDGFSKMFGVPKGRFIVCPPEQKKVAYNKMEIEHNVFTFIFVSTPDCHKNFETLCEAAKALEHKIGVGKFNVVLTIKGDENRYSKYLIKYEDIRKAMGAAAKETSKKYHEETIMKRWVKLFEEL